MKKVRGLATAFILVLLSLAMVLPAAPVLAAGEEVTLEKDFGVVGDKIDIEGTGFTTADGPVNIYFCAPNDPDSSIDEGDDIDDIDNYEVIRENKAITADPGADPDEGTWSHSNFEIPSELTDGEDDVEVLGPGVYYICVTYDDDEEIVAVADFTIRGIAISPTQGIPGEEIEIEGKGYTKNKAYTVLFDGKTVSLESSNNSGKTKSSGTFVCTIIAPAGSAGKHTIEVRTTSSEKSSATFTSLPVMGTVTPDTGKAGDLATVSGSGFASNSTIDIFLNNSNIGSGESDSSGNFSIAFDVPDVAAGVYELKVEDDDGNNGVTAFIVEKTPVPQVTTPQVTSQSSPGYPGMDMTISGRDFIPNTTVTVTLESDPIVVATTITDANGAFTAIFKVPKVGPGNHTITATDGTNSLTVPFYMDSTAPSTPTLLLPLPDSKAEVQSIFDWSDVSDPSGVTYKFQVATSPDFAAGTGVLEKTGLTDSLYTISELEKLQDNKKGETYYYRVKAVDGLGNEGGWSAPVAFSVGKEGAAVASWLIYVGIGVGGVALLLIGYFIGRRTAFASF